jgi:UDP-2,3-diacylglucosamine pyrophosphatase LpxH
MLVIISDLHLTDGSSGEIISDSAFRLFKNRMSDMAYDASWRCEEGEHCYRPIEHIDLLLLGDILDMIRSEKWNGALENIMPWTKQRQDGFFKNVEEIVDGILSFNASSFRILKGIADGDITIPKEMTVASDEETAAQKIKYRASPERMHVKVNIYYMIGNHDWFFFINDPRINNARNKVIDALGLANEKDKPFPYYYNDLAAIKQTQDVHRVFAEHGDRFDKTNFQTPHRDASSVGDVVVIKLLNEIPKKIEECLKKDNRKAGSNDEVNEFIKQLREIDNLRPYTLAPAWITQVLKDTKLNRDVVNDAIREALAIVIDDFRRNELISVKFVLAAELKLAELLLSQHFTIETLSNVMEHMGIGKDRLESYRKYAIEVSKDQAKDFFVMGHTHYAEVVPLSSYTGSNNEKRTKIYLNTGTWRSVHLKGADDESFISYKTMAIAGFFKDDERKGRPFEFWTGSLAL